MTPSTTTGTVEAIAFRPVDGETMRLIPECQVLTGRGLALENRPSGKREITLLSAEAWDEACRDLGTPVPWYFRRANFLIRGIKLAETIGMSLTIGPVRVRVHGETRPCKIMDAQQPGLRTALVPEVRGGVHAEVLCDGDVRIGDRVMVGEAG